MITEQRPDLINYCRNPDFYTGSILYWTVYSGVLSYSFTDYTPGSNSKWINVTSSGSTSIIRYDDKIPVLEGENISLDIMHDANSPRTIAFGLVYFNSQYDVVDSVQSPSVSTALPSEMYRYTTKVPRGVTYVQISILLAGNAGFSTKFSMLGITIQPRTYAMPVHGNYIFKDFSRTGNVAAGATETTQVAPVDENIIWKIAHIYWNIPAVPGGGTAHYFSIEYKNYPAIINQGAVGTAVLGLRQWQFDLITPNTLPNNNASLGTVAENFYCTLDEPLQLKYNNATVNIQTQPRTYKMMIIADYIDRI